VLVVLGLWPTPTSVLNQFNQLASANEEWHFSNHNSKERFAQIITTSPLQLEINQDILNEIIKTFRPADSKRHVVLPIRDYEVFYNGRNASSYYIYW